LIKKSIIIVLIVLIFLNSVGCYTYSQIEKDELIEIEKKDEIRITTFDNSVYYLIEVEIDRSVLMGYKYEKVYQRDRERRENVRVGDQISIPFHQIKEIKIDEFNPYLTALTVILIIGIPIAIVAFVSSTHVMGL